VIRRALVPGHNGFSRDEYRAGRTLGDVPPLRVQIIARLPDHEQVDPAFGTYPHNCVGGGPGQDFSRDRLPLTFGVLTRSANDRQQCLSLFLEFSEFVDLAWYRRQRDYTSEVELRPRLARERDAVLESEPVA
jgi:hypothetical protein